MRRLAVVACVAALLLACADGSDVAIPVKTAPPSRHDALVDQLRDDARAFAFSSGDWLEDEQDAPNFGLAWLARRGTQVDAAEATRRDAAKARALTLLDGAPVELEKIESALGLAELAAVDWSVLPALDGYVDRLDAAIHATGDFVNVDFSTSDPEADRLGPTALTAMIATLEADLTLFAGEDRRSRVLAIDAAIRTNALTDLASATGQARAYALGSDLAGIYETPNIAMLIEKARVFRLTKDLSFQLEARAVYAALQTLKLSSSPVTYSSPSDKDALKTDAQNLILLSSQADIAFALTLMFEITGEQHFIDEADSALDEVAALRGPWCSPVTMQCSNGLVHHELDGQLARTLCAGCTFRALWTIGYRRSLAGETF